MSKIGILGSGVVAKELAKGFLKHGHEVKIGTRDQSKLEEWKNNEATGAKLGSFSEVAAFGEIVVLAVKGTAALDALKLAGIDNLKGKTFNQMIYSVICSFKIIYGNFVSFNLITNPVEHNHWNPVI